jgi:hypothetical protein
MTQIITQTFTDQLRNPYLGGLLASAITQAIDQNLADTLISTVSRIYGDAIAQLFTDKTSSIVPTYTGSPALQALVNEINDSIQGIPDATIPGVAADIISKTLQDLFDEYISDMVPTASIDAALNAAVTAAEMPSANLTVAVYSYKGA